MAFHSNSSSGRVLVTGANGFTGKYVIQELTEAGYEVIGFVHAVIASPNEIQVDLTVIEQVRAAILQAKPDYVIHLGAISSVQHEAIDEFYKVNVIGTLNLLQALIDVGCQPKKVIVASSANIYGNISISPITEALQPHPVNHYACSKLAMEYMVQTFFEKLPIIITRPFNYTGVGQPDFVLIPKIVNHFRLQKRDIELGNIDVIRDFSDVRTVAHIYRLLMECEQQSLIANICSGEGHSLTNVLHYMPQLAGYEMQIHVNPAFVRANEVHRLIGSNTLLKSVIGNYNACNLQATLAWMYEKKS